MTRATRALLWSTLRPSRLLLYTPPLPSCVMCIFTPVVASEYHTEIKALASILRVRLLRPLDCRRRAAARQPAPEPGGRQQVRRCR